MNLSKEMNISKEILGISNSQVYKALLKEVKKQKKGLAKLFSTKISEEEARAVKRFYLSNMEIEQFDFLKYFRNVEELTLVNIRGIKNIQGMQNLAALTDLSISDTYIEDFSSLNYCSRLEYFDYMCEKEDEKCRRSDFTFLKYFPNLYQIDLTGNKVKDLSFLAGNSELKELVLTENPIESIKPLQVLQKLDWLEIEGCGLKELEDIEKFPALKSLYAKDNEFTEEQMTKYKEQLVHIEEVEF